MNSCPYVAGPACADCDGACWPPTQPTEPEPSPCEWCSRWNGAMQECDGTCNTITDDDWKHVTGPDMRHGGIGPAALVITITQEET